MIKGEIPFVRFLIPLVTGIALGISWPLTTLPWWLYGIFFLALSFFATYLFQYKKPEFYKRRWISGVLAHLLILSCGTILTLRSSLKYDSAHFSKTQSDALVVTVSVEPVASGNHLRFEADVSQYVVANRTARSCGKLYVYLRNTGKPLPISYGTRILIRSNYHVIDPPFNPGEFDLKAYLGRKQVYHRAYLDPEDIYLLSQGNANKLISQALTLRKSLVDKFDRHISDQDAAAMASTLILGYRAELSKDVITAYSKTGTLHILSVSGMHVGMVFIVLGFLLKPLSRISLLKLPVALFICVTVWGYALITGFSPSVCRAAGMITFIILGKALNKNLNSYNLLAISAFVLLIYNPFYLVDIGFQLSYLAVFGLIYLQPKIYHVISPSNRLLDHAWNYSALSLAAQLATFPISLYYFHQFPVYFLLSNLIVVLPTALIMYLGLIYLFIPWDFLLSVLGGILNTLIVTTNTILLFISQLPFSSIGGFWIDIHEYILIYLIVGSIILATVSKKKVGIYLALLFSVVFAAGTSLRQINQSRHKHLIFYSLRQQSAFACILNQRAYLVTDLLRSDRLWSYSISPALESRGVTSIINISADSTFVDKSQGIEISPNYVQFGNFSVFRWSSNLDGLTFKSNVKADAVLLSDNPAVTVRQVSRSVKFSILLIDGSNANYRIKEWQAEAERLGVKYRVLKGAPAYIVKG